MRIEKIVIENINSLTGRFEIDLTDGKYSEGLFAIVGPSGAGKSTVLDSVCLALYGKTPRIDTISETQDEIMNKNCAACLAEVVFVSRGKRYKALFSHQRAKGANPFRQVKREITEIAADGTGAIIASMIKEANEKIAEITGLTYSQFTRSIMLAQFQFAEFLKADSNERAAILEQISDMDIYRNISAATYERAKRERTSLEELRTRMQLLKVLDESQINAFEQEQRKLASLVTLHNSLRERFISCRNSAEKLQNFRKELEVYLKEQPALEKDMSDKAKQFEQAEKEEKQTKAALLELQKILKAVRELDNKINVQKSEVSRLDGEAAEDAKKINTQKLGILNVFKKYVPNANNDELKRMYETEDIGSILRLETKAELESAQANEKQVQGEINAALQGKGEDWWHKRVDALKILFPAAQAREEIKQAGDKLDVQRKTHEELIKSSAELEAREKDIDERLVYARLEEKFGEERRKLENGKPCPLCGATEHPHKDKPFDSVFLEEAQKQKTDIAGRIKQAQRELAASGSLIAELERTIKEKTQFAQQSEQELAALGSGAEYGEITAEQAAKRLAEAEGAIRGYTALLNKLGAAKDEVTAKTQKLAGVDIDVATVNAAKQAIKELGQQAAARQKQKDDAEKLYGQLRQERGNLFGEKDADSEEQKAQELSDKALRHKEACGRLKESAERAFEQNKKDITRTQEHIGNESRMLGVQYSDAKISMLEAKAAERPASEELKALEESFIETAAGFGEAVPERPEEYGGVIDILGGLSSAETSRQGAIKQALADNARNVEEMAQLKENAKKQEQTCARWDRLNALIGSADGIKFSRMAQGYTFEALLKYANNCLKRMTDRYVLVRDVSGAKPLELAVADNYQAGDRRPVSNLSGGESFLVSLALALGMSEMSSGKTQIDSLFIDEGFASLDEDYLEAALQTLSSLGNREGKLVGVISHVGALKERIDAQIEVKKLSGGRSTLTGPGVRALGE